jgi:demethylmenaquinone methyltransferase/2-methoxy-6-polyprenyl-1,4-benzoquinol methylase
MKLLETRASRYDRGMRLLSFGRITGHYRAVAARVPPGSEVLEIGCGTGGVTAELVRRGCRVTAVDRSPQMLAVAAAKPALAGTGGRLRLLPLAITGLDRTFGAGTFDYVVCCLVLSELTATEERYALDSCCRLLRQDGTLVIADEVLPAARWRRLTYHATRLPVVALAYLLTQATTSHVRGIDDKLRSRGLEVVEHASPRASFGIILGRKRACPPRPRG